MYRACLEPLDHDQVDVLASAEVAASASEMKREIEDQEEEVELPSVEAIEDRCSDEQLFKGKKVLLVEDDGRNILALVTALREKGNCGSSS